MEIGSRFFISILISITVVIGFPQVSFPAEKNNSTPATEKKSNNSSSNSKVNPSKPDKKIAVYCCEKGKVVRKNISKDQLNKNSNTCSTSKSKAESYCEIYCCVNGEIKKISPGECRKYEGKPYKTASEAKRKCKPADVFCCVNGKAKEISPQECRKQKGEPYKTASEAKRRCRPTDVFCCINGKVTATSPQKCRKDRGRAYTTASEAKRQCKPKEVYCCLNEEVKQLSFDECMRKRGKPFSSKISAERLCKGQSPTVLTWCCDKGKVSRTSTKSCIKNRGHSYATMKAAQKVCGSANLKSKKSILTPADTVQSTLPERVPAFERNESCFCSEIISHGIRGSVRGRDARGVVWNFEAPAGVAGALVGLKIGHFYEICGSQPDRSMVIGNPFIVTGYTKSSAACTEQSQCCIDGKLYSYTKAQCKATEGRYYRSHGEAVTQCLPGFRKPKKPMQLPDLAVIGTSVTANCFMRVTAQNIGGPINAADHTAAKIHLSAGPGLISPKTQLSDIDPAGTLRTPGGSISYTTKLRITESNQATLVWLDTQHAITESNEINNGDDTLLTCKTPLVWCCAKGTLGQTSKALCEKARGSHYKSAKEAIKVCGDTAQLPDSKEEKSSIPPINEIRGTSPQSTQSEIPKTVTKSVERGVRIESPTSSYLFYQGETITIRYRFMQDHAVAGDIIFTAVHRGIGSGSAYTTVTYDPLLDYRVTKEVELAFSADAPLGEYIIMASHPASGAYGESDSFRLEVNNALINFIQPETGGLFHPGGTLAMRYQFSGRVEPGTITFTLYSRDSSTPLDTITHSYSPGPAGMPLQSIWLLEWPLPSGISSEHCFIVATHPHATGTSNIFAIQPFGEGSGLDEPYDIEIIDIFREDDGVVKARIQVSGFFADRIDIQVNGDVIQALINSSHQTDVIVAEMPTPVILLNLERDAAGEMFEVTVDPLNRFHETDESNNSLTKTLYYWESFGEIYASHLRDRISSGGSVRVPCNLSSYERSLFAIAFTINNYGSEPISGFSRLVEVRQSGVRSIGGGRLGSEDFDAVIPSSSTVMGRSGESTIDAGKSGAIIVHLNDLIVSDDSTITFTVRDPIAAWSGVVSPYTVNFNFGRVTINGECLY